MDEKSQLQFIAEAIQASQKSHPTRENALVITKLEEALMWHKADQQKKMELARNSGVGPRTI